LHRLDDDVWIINGLG